MKTQHINPEGVRMYLLKVDLIEIKQKEDLKLAELTPDIRADIFINAQEAALN